MNKICRNVCRFNKKQFVLLVANRRTLATAKVNFTSVSQNGDKSSSGQINHKGKSPEFDVDDIVLEESSVFNDVDLPQDIKVTANSDGEPNFNVDEMIMNSSTDEADVNETFSDSEEGYMGDDDIAAQILNIALQYVPQYGWSSSAVEKAVEALDLSPSSAGMFKRGGVDLVLHFIDQCNSKLAEHLSNQAREKKSDHKISQAEFIENAIKLRLSMLIPYIQSWPQALTLLASPAAVSDCLESGANMIDEIWYHAGDLSTDTSWYTKRVALAGVYVATELYMLNDRSADFQDTWDFLKRRLNDAQAAKAAKDSLENAVGDVASLASAGITTAQNMLGLNSRNRPFY